MGEIPKRIGIASDTHCGSYYGLWPLEPPEDSDLPGLPGKFSGTRYLMECWADAWESVPDLDLLIINGDVIDGSQKKSQGSGILTPVLGQQVRGAIEVWRPAIARAKKVVRTHGTPYHEGFHQVMNAFDHYFGIKTAEQVLDIEIDGKILNVAHHPDGGAVLYAGTKLTRDLMMAQLAAIRNKVPLARWVIRSHVHNYALLETESATMITTPCWQLQTPYAKKAGYWKWQPDIGLIVLEWDELSEDYRVRKLFYEAPKPQPIAAGDLR